MFSFSRQIAATLVTRDVDRSSSWTAAQTEVCQQGRRIPQSTPSRWTQMWSGIKKSQSNFFFFNCILFKSDALRNCFFISHYRSKRRTDSNVRPYVLHGCLLCPLILLASLVNVIKESVDERQWLDCTPVKQLFGC